MNDDVANIGVEVNDGTLEKKKMTEMKKNPKYSRRREKTTTLKT